MGTLLASSRSAILSNARERASGGRSWELSKANLAAFATSSTEQSEEVEAIFGRRINKR